MTTDRRYYISVEVDFFDHQKVVALGEVIALKHLRAVAWCHRQLTDGFIPAPALTPIRVTKREAAALVKAGLWEAVSGGWRIHDYLRHQPGRDEMRKRSKAAKHAAGVRWGSEPHAERNAERMPDASESHADGNAERNAESMRTYYVRPRAIALRIPVAVTGDADRKSDQDRGRRGGLRPVGPIAAQLASQARARG